MAGVTLSGCSSKKSLVWSGPYQGRDSFFGLIISFKPILEAFSKSAFFRYLVKFNHVKGNFSEIIALKVYLHNIYVFLPYSGLIATGRIT